MRDETQYTIPEFVFHFRGNEDAYYEHLQEAAGPESFKLGTLAVESSTSENEEGLDG